jgi:hypothetical protein
MSSPWFPPLLLLRRAAFVALLLAGVSLRAQDDIASSSSSSSNNAGTSQATKPTSESTEPSSQSTESSSQSTQSSSESTQPSSESTQPYPSNEQPVAAGVQGLAPGASLPPDAFGENNPSGVPYSSVLTKTGADVNSINDVSGSPFRTGISGPTNIGGAEGTFGIQTGNIGFDLLFPHGTEPQDADIKVGPLYIKFHSIEGLLLYDDNYNFSQNDRKSEILALLRLNLTVVAQLTDDIQLALSGAIDYLPLQNQVGVETSRLSGLGLFLPLTIVPLFGFQLVDDTVIGGWPVRFADDFRIGTGSFDYANGVDGNFDLFQGGFIDRDDQGRYVFVSSPNRSGNNTETINQTSNLNASVVYFSNSVSALTERDIPDDIRLTVRLDHEDLWYNQDNRGLPSSRDDLFASVVSERPNLRFEPFASYEATYVSGSPGITQIFNTGLSGPIDDQIFLHANAGYYIDANEHSGYLYGLSLAHDAGPYTTEYLSLNRNLSYFDQEELTSEYYNLNQILGPNLVSSLFLANATYHDLIGSTGSHSEYIGGLQLTWQMGPRTSLQLSGIYQRQIYSSRQRIDTITARAVLNRTITDTLALQLLYEYQRAVSNFAGDSYYENLVYLRIIKYLE